MRLLLLFILNVQLDDRLAIILFVTLIPVGHFDSSTPGLITAVKETCGYLGIRLRLTFC